MSMEDYFNRVEQFLNRHPLIEHVSRGDRVEENKYIAKPGPGGNFRQEFEVRFDRAAVERKMSDFGSVESTLGAELDEAYNTQIFNSSRAHKEKGIFVKDVARNGNTATVKAYFIPNPE